jgi:hypothetical protein
MRSGTRRQIAPAEARGYTGWRQKGVIETNFFRTPGNLGLNKAGWRKPLP